MTNKEVMQRALDCLLAWEEESSGYGWSLADEECVEALRAALAQPEPKRVAWMSKERGDVSLSTLYFNKDEEIVLLYTAPPQREWVGLTDEERLQNPYCAGESNAEAINFARAIEQALKEKNKCG